MDIKYSHYMQTTENWMGEIPSHWQLLNIKALLCERKEKNSPITTDYILSLSARQGVIPYGEKKSGGNKAKEDISLYNIAYPNDLLVNCMNVVSGSSGISRYYGAISPVYYALYSRGEVANISFIGYIFKLSSFYQSLVGLGNGILMKQSKTGKLNTVRKRIPMNKLNRVVIPVPSRTEQDQIVRYLSLQNEKISRLIKEKRKEIRRLNERKLTLINRYISKGINSNVEMVDSTVNWLGSIPAHWSVDKIKQHFSIKKDIAGKEGYDVLSITQQGLQVKNISTNEGQLAQNYAKYQLVNPGDFAMNHMDLITGYVDCSPYFGVTSPDYRVFVLDDTENCFGQYFLKVFQVCYKRRIFYAFGRGAASQGRWRLPKTEFLSFLIPVPPINEQREIAEACLAVETETKRLTAYIEKEISLIIEYHTRLISNVVTGKIDVRNVEVTALEAEPADTDPNELIDGEDADDESETNEYNETEVNENGDD